MIHIQKNNTKVDNQSIVLLADSTSSFHDVDLSSQEMEYIYNRIAEKSSPIAINKGSYWIFIHIVDLTCPACKEKEKARRGANEVHECVVQQKIKSVKIKDLTNNPDLLYAFAEGLLLSNYQFLKYVSKREEKQNPLASISIETDSLSPKQIDRLNDVVEAVYIARDMINEPANFMTSGQLAREFETMAQKSGFDIQVLDKKSIEKLKMGGLLAVNQGSCEEPTFSILTWHPADARNQQPIVLVGKGLVYDTGGLSLKPTPNSMDYMKCDMAGGAAVGAILYAIAKAKLPVYIIGLVPSTDNRLSAKSYSPGDIITMYDGASVEVLNTDAEGRLILADALGYAKQFNPELVIDMATLTGAAHRAIGTQAMVGMGNAPSKIMEQLKDCGESVFERIAEFPFWDEYAESLKSDIADLKNVGGEDAGAITAGKFLEHFTDYPYIHLDIAGPSFLKTADSYRSKGGTGVGVRLLFEFLARFCEGA